MSPPARWPIRELLIMRLYYHQSPGGNFGDDLNALIWPRVLPDCLAVGDPRYCEDVQLLGIGTILGHRLPPARINVVMGSGVGYGPEPARVDSPGVHVLAVRGPLSARALSLPARCAVTDSAILVRSLDHSATPSVGATRGEVVFMPHHSAAVTGGWERACREAGLLFLDPRGDCERTLEAIARARLVIADAMHAAVVADALRVPWIPVVSSSEICTFKWLDWTMSLNMPYRPIRLPLLTPQHVARQLCNALFAQRYHLPDANAEVALDAHARAEKRRSQPWWKTWRRFAHPIDHRLLEPARRRWSYMTEPWGRQLDATVRVLRRLALSDGFLSDDRVLDARLETFQERLEELRALLDGMRREPSGYNAP